jgi:hypothetical protein
MLVRTTEKGEPMRYKTLFVSAMLGGSLLVGTVAPSVAADKCGEHVRKAEDKLRKEIDRHGESSRQAEHARHDLETQRANCNAEAHPDHHDMDHHDMDHHEEEQHNQTGGY